MISVQNWSSNKSIQYSKHRCIFRNGCSSLKYVKMSFNNWHYIFICVDHVFSTQGMICRRICKKHPANCRIACEMLNSAMQDYLLNTSTWKGLALFTCNWLLFALHEVNQLFFIDLSFWLILRKRRLPFCSTVI